jgi:hypothetical protein
MAWVTPKTDYLTGDLVTAQEMNNIGTNLDWLKNEGDGYTLDEASDYSTTSTSFVDIDATNLALTITTEGGDVLIGVNLTLYRSGSADNVYIDVHESVSNARLGGDDGMAATYVENTIPSRQIGFVWLAEGLSAGSHTFKLQWKTRVGTEQKIASGAGISDKDLHPQFWVREVS